MKRLFWTLAVISLAVLACGPIDLAREVLGRLPTVTPADTSASESHDSAVWYVATDGDDVNSCAEPAASCRTVQAAIDKADDDDIIQIAPGTYAESYSRATAGMWIEDKTLSLRGAGSEATFLEADRPGRAVVVIRDADVGLSRLTVQGAREGVGFGVSAARSHLRLSDVVIQDNEGIGVIVEDAGATFDFADITVRRNGGGLALGGDGSLRASVIIENVGPGILNSGVLTVVETIVEGNRAENGPGITNNTGGQVTLERSTVARNTATAATHSRALGINNLGTMTILNSTVSSNHIVAGGSGGGIANRGELTLRYSTVAANQDIGILSFGGTVTFENSLIAGHSDQDCSITASSNSFMGVNLDGDESCTRWFSSERSTRSLSIGPLADNGGPTETHALLPDSPALDAASGVCPVVDQRGVSRPAGSACDVGAYEFDPLTSATETSLEGTPLPPLVTVTPTTAPSPSTVSVDALCWKGPGSLYEVVSAVQAGTQVTLLGRGLEGNWWIVDNPRYPGVACWLPGDKLDVDPTLDLTGLPRLAPPPLPTPTPVPGCLYKGPNDPQAVCYAIDQCPVPFEQSLGACTP